MIPEDHEMYFPAEVRRNRRREFVHHDRSLVGAEATVVDSWGNEQRSPSSRCLVFAGDASPAA